MFKYKVLQYNVGMGDSVKSYLGRYEEIVEKINKDLDSEGEDGWELVSTETQDMAGYMILLIFLKKEK